MGLAVVVMGVSGAGKSTLGPALAEALGCPFVEGDDFHPLANRAKMAAGIPLNDEDRRPYLDRVARAIAARRREGVVVACSALKRRYRDLIRETAPEVTFVLPVVGRKALMARLGQRRGHFMPASLLDSQLAALEPPQGDERAILVDGAAAVGAQVEHTLEALQTGAAPPASRSPDPTEG